MGTGNPRDRLLTQMWGVPPLVAWILCSPSNFRELISCLCLVLPLLCALYIQPGCSDAPMVRGAFGTAAVLAAGWEKLCMSCRTLPLQSQLSTCLTGEERMCQCPQNGLVWCKTWKKVFDMQGLVTCLWPWQDLLWSTFLFCTQDIDRCFDLEYKFMRNLSSQAHFRKWNKSQSLGFPALNGWEKNGLEKKWFGL